MSAREIHRSAQQARAGSTPYVVRYVLTVSLALAIVAMLAVVLV